MEVENRLFGREIRKAVTGFEIMVHRTDVMRDFARQIEREFTPCSGCKNLNLTERQDYSRDVRHFTLACRASESHQTFVACPDGFRGAVDSAGRLMEVSHVPVTLGVQPINPRSFYISTPKDEATNSIMEKWLEDKIRAKSELFKKWETEYFNTTINSAATTGVADSTETGVLTYDKLKKLAEAFQRHAPGGAFDSDRPTDLPPMPPAPSRDVPRTAGEAW